MRESFPASRETNAHVCPLLRSSSPRMWSRQNWMLYLVDPTKRACPPALCLKIFFAGRREMGLKIETREYPSSVLRLDALFIAHRAGIEEGFFFVRPMMKSLFWILRRNFRFSGFAWIFLSQHALHSKHILRERRLSCTGVVYAQRYGYRLQRIMSVDVRVQVIGHSPLAFLCVCERQIIFSHFKLRLWHFSQCKQACCDP